MADSICTLSRRGVRLETEHTLTVAEREDSPDDNEWIQENSFEINQ